MAEARREWSLGRRLSIRLVLASALVTLLTSIVVAAHYVSDLSDLRQRKVMELVDGLAEDLRPVLERGSVPDAFAARHPFFTRFPDAYGWRLLDSAGRTLAGGNEGVFARAGLPERGLPRDWTQSLPDGGWAAGTSVRAGEGTYHVVAVAISDPAWLLGRLVLEEVVVHTILPLLPFAALITLVNLGAVRETLTPLRVMAEKARAVQPDRPEATIAVENAPREVADLVAALNAALERLRAAAERERAFVADAAHALRTPLAALQARIELAEPSGVPGAMLAGEIAELARLAEQLLASANAERLVVEPSARVDLVAIARRVAADMAPLAARAGGDVSLDAPEATVTVNGDADAIAHALRNLVDNAIKVSPPGGLVRLIVDTDARISVADRGPGVPAERREAIFQRFSREGFGSHSGAGLGLAIVRRIMDAHGGTVTIADTAAGGASFTLAFRAHP